VASYHVETYGCTANRGESRRIERRLRDAGHHPAPEDDADVAILNTCTVVEKTERNMLSRAQELDETADELVVTGCMALAQGDEFAEAGVDAAVCHWDEVPQYVLNGECPTTTPDAEPVLDGVVGILPIARGCTSDCSYCITKHATGRIDSPPIEENVDLARSLIHAGARELRVTGQDTAVYGWDQDEAWLPELLRRICAIDGDFRVRLGMANPWGVHAMRDELAAVFADHEALYNFLHAPVQSGSDPVLSDMRRPHTVDEFRTVVDAFDATLDRWTLATDFVVGFPTADEDDFQRTVALCRAVRPERINVTRFSKRPGTDAAEMDGLGGTVKKERSRELSRVKRDVLRDVHESMVGECRSVLVVEHGRDDSVKCRTDAYRQVVIQGARERGIAPGDRVTVECTDAEPVYCVGEPV
jgi:threonylcarbamoyladenosine tRNA methylthiotransferase CDKAL1